MTSTPPSFDGAVALTHCGLIRARGEDAAAFLHGQLTNDFAQLDTTRARLAGYCSAKGRLLASFVGWKLAPDDLLLLCSADLLPATLKRLSMFVLRAKCKLADATGEFRLLGLAGDGALQWLGADAPPAAWDTRVHAGATVVRLPDAASRPVLYWTAPLDAELPPLPALDLDTWRWLEVQGGVARIENGTADRFVPQMLNYELIGGVDFKKGCYPGQEIVARSQYRGTTKRRSFLFDTLGGASVGQEIFHSGDPGQPAGMVVNVAPQPAPGPGSSLLAEVKLAALEGGSLHLGDPDGPRLVPAPMPYAVQVSTPD
jgi:folate-binding protein YgfZ